MPDLGLKSFDKLYPMMIRKYQDLIVDQNASEADKINSIILKLNALGKLSNDVVRDWNTVYQWAMNDGLNQDVSNKLEAMRANGEISQLLQNIFDQLVGDMTTLHTTVKNTLVNVINEVDDLAKANQTAINTNTTNIATNTANIATNTANIATNTANIASNTSALAQIAKQYDVFPDATTITGMSDSTTFTTRGYYTKGDGFGCTYVAFTSWQYNSIQIGGKYVVPISQPLGEVFLPYYGIRTGSSYAVANSTIMTSLLSNITFAALLKFPSGHFYFNQTIDLGANNKQLKLTGAAPIGYTMDVNANGLTWLHFPNLTNGQSGIACTSATISNIIFYGNPSTYNLSIDRSKTVTAPDQIVTETTTATTYGISQSAGSVDIQNCGFYYFYYGVSLITSNNTIDNVFARYCHYAVSIGGDTKVSRIFGFNVMVALQITASISSAITVRGDSIGQHLVQVTSGYGIYLSDLDADYCLKSILHFGDGVNYVNINRVYVDGIHGRSNVYRAYDSSTTPEPTVSAITTAANVEEYPLISVAQRVHLYSAKFVLMGYGNYNPLDSTSNYLTPSILLASDVSSDLHNIEISIIDALSSADTNPLTPTWVSNRIKTLSTLTRSLELSVKTALDTLFYSQNGVSAGTYTKVLPKGVASTDTTTTISTNYTISTNAYVIRFNPTSTVTGITLSAGTYSGQEVTLINEATTSGYTITFSATGNVAGGTGVTIPITSAMKFVWDAGTSLWYKTS